MVFPVRVLIQVRDFLLIIRHIILIQSHLQFLVLLFKHVVIANFFFLLSSQLLQIDYFIFLLINFFAISFRLFLFFLFLFHNFLPLALSFQSFESPLKSDFFVLRVESGDYFLEFLALLGCIYFGRRHLQFPESESFLGTFLRVFGGCSPQGEKVHLLSERVHRSGFLPLLVLFLLNLLFLLSLVFLFSE